MHIPSDTDCLISEQNTATLNKMLEEVLSMPFEETIAEIDVDKLNADLERLGNEAALGLENMRSLTLAETADYLDAAIIDETINSGHAVVHYGRNPAGVRFMMLNNYYGETVLTEGL